MGLLLWIANMARAEGSAALGGDQIVQATTVLYVDILDFPTETLAWSGDSSVDLYDPSGVFVATLDDGDLYVPLANGAFRVELSDEESDWDLAVSGATPGFGRVWSYVWNLDANGFGEAVALDESVYALVEGGGPGHDGVVELFADGFAGNVYTLQANKAGVPGANGRSVVGQVGPPGEFAIYLAPPEIASYNPLSPVVATWDYGAGSAGCDVVSPGALSGSFQFDANVEGTYHLVCDLDQNGTFDITSDDDLHLLGTTTIGINDVPWDGTDNLGDPVTPGAYDCQVRLTVGEFHYVGEDIETSFQGFGLFSVDAALQRTGLSMYWNDTDVQADETSNLPNGEVSLVGSGPLGVHSGDYLDARVANVNARAWGSFVSQSKGNENTLDTYTWLESALSGSLVVTVESPSEDADGDALPSWEEACEIGTDPADEDTDDDGLLDSEEHFGVTDPLDADTDEDGLLDGTEVGVLDADAGATTTDPVNPDTDGDGLLDGEEDADHDGASPATIGGTGTSGSGETSPLAADTDGDGLSDLDEAVFGTSPLDTDADDDALLDAEEQFGVTDPLDPDTDDDGLLDGTEAGVLDADAGATTTDPVNPDTDGDGLLDGEEDADHDGASPATIGGTGTSGAGETSPLVADTDGDGLSDGDELVFGTSPVDTDTDDDALLDAVELETTDTDPLVADTDGDRLSDGDEVNLHLTNPLAVDTDGGSVDDGTEVLDNLTNPLDPSDDVPITEPPPTDTGTPPIETTDTGEKPVSGRFYGGACDVGGGSGRVAWAALCLAAVVRRRARP